MEKNSRFYILPLIKGTFHIIPLIKERKVFLHVLTILVNFIKIHIVHKSKDLKLILT